MIPSREDRFDRNAGALLAEETLRMIASLPAPAGLEDRMKAGLRSAPQHGMVVAWAFRSAGGWMHTAGMRAAAAAGIVLAVAGGGWGVFSHIEIAPVPSALVEPQLPSGAGRFSTAGAMHVPQTVEGPVVAAPASDKQKLSDKQKQDESKRSQGPRRRAAKKGKAHAGASSSANQPVNLK
jgi:hypothetical protein